MNISLAQLESWLELPVTEGNEQCIVTGICTDSRSAMPGSVFIALRGERFDAHDFLTQVVSQGAVAVVVERPIPGLSVPSLMVPDTKLALATIARHWRWQFTLPVIAVTGSNGKTTVKEMIAAILLAAFGGERFLATRGNFNNDIGVPLTLLRLNAAHKAAVIELGMNHSGEIATLTALVQPTVALVNNAQREHQEFMLSVQAVAEENGNVIRGLSENGTAIFPADDPYTGLWRSYARSNRLSFGLTSDADVRASFVSATQGFGSDLSVTLPDRRTFTVRLSAPGVHNIRNALAAIACTWAIGIDMEMIQRGLESFVPVNGRLKYKLAKAEGCAGAVVIDDTYNANPESVQAAIDVLAQTHAKASRLLVLGEMGEVGSQGRQFHQEVGAYAQQCGIEKLFTLGEQAIEASTAFGPHAKHFSDIAALLTALDSTMTPETIVLIKGSRFMKMERVVAHLVETTSEGMH